MDQKKATIILLLASFFVILIALVGCSRNSDYLKNINLKDLEKKINNKDRFILLISNKDCINCKNFEPKLKSIINDNKIIIYKIDTFYLSVKEFNTLKNYTSHNGTPTIEFFVNGTENSTLNRIVGNVSNTVVIQKLKDNNYIK